ncbi:MAG: response regulator [Spirochaetota bacterium]
MKILVIDDNKAIRNVLSEFLSEFGNQVITAADGVNGLEVFRHSGNFDIVFTDRTMPGGVLGEEVMREIKRLSPKTFVVLMSGDDQKEVINAGITAGADAILCKPFKLAEVDDLINDFFPLFEKEKKG